MLYCVPSFTLYLLITLYHIEFLNEDTYCLLSEIWIFQKMSKRTTLVISTAYTRRTCHTFKKICYRVSLMYRSASQKHYQNYMGRSKIHWKYFYIYLILILSHPRLIVIYCNSDIFYKTVRHEFVECVPQNSVVGVSPPRWYTPNFGKPIE